MRKLVESFRTIEKKLFINPLIMNFAIINLGKDLFMNKYKLIALDIDGTLTNSKKQITPNTLKALLHLQEVGIKVVLASGRPTAGIKALSKELKLDQHGSFILSFNGAQVINCKTNEVIYQNIIPRHFIPQLYAAAKKNNVGIISYEGDSIIAATPIDEYIEREAFINQLPIKEVSNFPDYISFDVNKCLMTGESNYLAIVEERLKKEFGTKLNIYRSEPYFLEIMPQHIDKAYSLRKLLEYLGLTKEEMICCGDGFNDLSMIEYAGLGVAMANAQEKVREIADYITLSNDDDGIVHVIEKFILA